MRKGGQTIPRSKGLRKRANKGASAKRGEFAMEPEEKDDGPKMAPVSSFLFHTIHLNMCVLCVMLQRLLLIQLMQYNCVSALIIR